MDLDHTHYFITVAKARSFRKASEVLAMPPSTLSDRIAALERSHGTTLIVRTTRSLTLTEAGRELYDQAAPALASLLAVGDRIANRQREPSGTLRITAPTDFAVSELAAAVRGYQARFPKVCVGSRKWCQSSTGGFVHSLLRRAGFRGDSSAGLTNTELLSGREEGTAQSGSRHK